MSKRCSLLFAATLMVVVQAGCEQPTPARSNAHTTTGAGTSRTTAGAGHQAPFATWPVLVHDQAGLDRLIAARSTRPAPSEPRRKWTAARLLETLSQQLRLAKVWAGHAAIAGELSRRIAGKRAFLLFGSFHDSGAQLRAFHRLSGPMGIRGLDLIALEQLDADGRFRGMPASSQRGDDALLRRYLARGEQQALTELMLRQRRHNYTAWKFGYLDQVLDVLVTARAHGRPLSGCDMPTTMQRELRAKASHLGGLRELHCALALGDRMRAERLERAALFLGQAHASPHGLARFLPAEATVLAISMFGGRSAGPTLERELAKRLRISAPLMIAVGEGELLLLVRGGELDAPIERIWEVADTAAAGRHQLAVRSSRPGTLWVGGRSLRLDNPDQPATMALPAGNHAFLFAAAATPTPARPSLLAGELTIPPNGNAELALFASPELVSVIARGKRP